MEMRRVTVATSGTLIVHANADRKCLTLYNYDDSNGIKLNKFKNLVGSASTCFYLPPKSSIVFKIPEDTPQDELWGDADTSQCQLYVIEAFKWKGAGKRNI